MSQLNDSSLDRAQVLTRSERDKMNQARYARERVFEGTVDKALAKEVILQDLGGGAEVRYHPQWNSVEGRDQRGNYCHVTLGDYYFCTEDAEPGDDFVSVFRKEYWSAFKVTRGFNKPPFAEGEGEPV